MRAGFLLGNIPRHKITGGILFAGVIGVALLGCALENAIAAFGASARHSYGNGLCKAALRIAGACKESAKAPGFNNELLAADITEFV